MFTRTDLDTLLNHDEAPALSIFLPTHTAGRETRQDPIRLRNLMADATERLVGEGMRRPDADQLLEPVRRLVEDEFFWRHQDRGLAVFAAKGVFHAFRVPVELEEKLVVGSGFHLRPLLPLVGADLPYLVLTLTAHSARMLSGSRAGLSEVEDIDIPRSVEGISAETDYQSTRHANPAVRHASRRNTAVSAVKTHNFGEAPEEQRKAQLLQYLHRVAAGADAYVAGRHIPMVLAAQPEIRGNFLALGEFRHAPLYELDINPDALDETDLHNRSWELVQPSLEETENRGIDRFYSLYNDGSAKTSADVPRIVKAARFGQVDMLLVNRNAQPWGRYDEEADKVVVRNSSGQGSGSGSEPGLEPGDEDLLDRAAKDTIRTGGTVILVDQDRLRPGSRLDAGAVLRFELPKA